MSNKFGKIQKNAYKFEMDKIYQNMTPEQYREGIKTAVKNAISDLEKEYMKELKRMQDEYNSVIQESVMIAMDTLAVEMIYELGNVLECYKDEPEYLDQKIDIVQNIYEQAITSIEKYASYKNDNQAQKAFQKKKKMIRKIFGIYGDELDKI